MNRKQYRIYHLSIQITVTKQNKTKKTEPNTKAKYTRITPAKREP